MSKNIFALENNKGDRFPLFIKMRFHSFEVRFTPKEWNVIPFFGMTSFLGTTFTPKNLESTF